MHRHPLDLLSLLAGALFLAVGLAGFAGPLRIPVVQGDVLLSVAAVLVGLGILATLRPRRDPVRAGFGADTGFGAGTDIGTGADSDLDAATGVGGEELGDGDDLSR